MAKNKVDTIYDKLPTQIRETVESFVNSRLDHKLSEYVLRGEFEERIKPKLDYVVFKDYKERIDGKTSNNKN